MREDWIECSLIEGCDIHDNLRKPINSKERNERINGKSEEQLFPYYGATGQVGFIDDYLTDGEFVLIGEDAAPFLDYSKDVAYQISGKTWVNNHAHILKSKFNDEFLRHYLNNFNYKDYVSGTTRLKLTQGRLKQIPLKIAPLPEQRAIVAKIEELFSDLDKGIADLKKAQDQLKVYRQAVLKKAFEGELTKEWREQRKSQLHRIDELLKKYEDDRKKGWELNYFETRVLSGKKPSNDKWKSRYPKPEEVLDSRQIIPENGWAIKSLDAISSRVTYGITVRPKYTDKGVPLVSAKELKNNIINSFEAKKVSLEDYQNQPRKCRIYENDVLFSKTGTIGRVAVAENIDLMLSSQNIAVISCVVNPHYLKYALRNPIIQSLAKSNVKAVAVSDLQLGILKRFPIPIPLEEEQHQIVQEIESRLSVCDKVEESITESLEKAKALRQSILKKAFEGTLLSEEEIAACKSAPDYEPASVLLEKIKAEKNK